MDGFVSDFIFFPRAEGFAWTQSCSDLGSYPGGQEPALYMHHHGSKFREQATSLERNLLLGLSNDTCLLGLRV